MSETAEASADGHQPKPQKEGARLWPILATIAVVLALASLANPYVLLATQLAERGTPTHVLRDITVPDTGWCLAGDFQAWDSASHPMNDRGLDADEEAGDGIYSAEFRFDAAGHYLWVAVACGDWRIQIPPQASWAVVKEPGQVVRFKLVQQRTASGQASRILLVAEDGHDAYTATGGFQGWRHDEGRTALTPFGASKFQFYTRVASPATFEVRIVGTGTWHSVGANGRTVDIEGFEVTTVRENEPMVFRLNAQTGVAEVIYGFPSALAWLAYEGGAGILTAVFLGALLLVLCVPAKHWVLNHPSLSRHGGCPRCGSHRIERIPRTARDRSLERVGLRFYRYECTECPWEGLRAADPAPGP